MMVRVLVMAIAMTRAFARVDFSYSKCANYKKYRGMQAAGRQPAGDREPHGSSNVSNPRLVGRTKPYANRIRGLHDRCLRVIWGK